MNKKIKYYILLVWLLLLNPIVMLAQDIDPPPTDPEIDPPPPAPIDGSIALLVVAGIVFAAYYFYRTNLKIEKK